MGNLLNISPSPHTHGKVTTEKLMLGVILALTPALITSVFYFGTGAIIVTGCLCYIMSPDRITYSEVHT